MFWLSIIILWGRRKSITKRQGLHSRSYPPFLIVWSIIFMGLIGVKIRHWSSPDLWKRNMDGRVVARKYKHIIVRVKIVQSRIAELFKKIYTLNISTHI